MTDSGRTMAGPRPEADRAAVTRPGLSRARLAGRVVLGLGLGLALLPALLELMALAGSASAFKYQGF